MRNNYNCIETDEFLIGFPKDITTYCNANMADCAAKGLDETYDDLKFVRDFIKYLGYSDDKLIRVSKSLMDEFNFHVINYLDLDDDESEDES